MLRFFSSKKPENLRKSLISRKFIDAFVTLVLIYCSLLWKNVPLRIGRSLIDLLTVVSVINYRDIALSVSKKSPTCHCEERSDVAI